MKAKQNEVFEVVANEREYQDKRWPGHKHTNTEFLVYIDHYVKEAFAAVSVQDDDKATYPALRKIAALAVAAMEQNGFARRIDAQS